MATNKPIRKFSDFSFTFSRHPITNQLTVKNDSEAIRQSIRNILLTRRGEKLMDPRFGSPVYELLFSSVGPAVETVAQDEIRRVLEQYEPRVDVQDVRVQYNHNSVKIDVVVSIKNTPQPISIEVLINRLR